MKVLSGLYKRSAPKGPHLSSHAINLIVRGLFPQCPANLQVKMRHLKGTREWVPVTCGGFFARDTGKSMTMRELRKAAALTIDVDPYDWDGAAERWGATRKERKAAMRAATAAELNAWLNEVGLLHMVIREAAAVGLPAEPNRVIMTGHGYCLIYWLPEHMGWVDGEWSPARMKAAIKGWLRSEDAPWWWDESAKDIGTRVFPVPGFGHRDTGKPVRRVYAMTKGSDGAALEAFFNRLEGLAPAVLPKQARKVARKRNNLPKQASGAWSYRPWLLGYPALEIGERAVCPLCQGSGYKRMDEAHYACFSCRTRFFVAPDRSQQMWPDATAVQLDAHGHAQWPDAPERLVNAARTGAGKTHLMERMVKRHLAPGLTMRRVLAISPTIALAGQLAQRLDVEHADSGTTTHLNLRSIACCFASLRRCAGGVSTDTLGSTMVLVDEIESCLQQLLGMLASDVARETYNLLVFCLSHAGRVMLADAHAGPCTQRLLQDVAAYQKSIDKQTAPWAVWTTAPHCHRFACILPLQRKTKRGEMVTVRSADALHKGLLAERISDGTRVAVYIPGREAARGFAQVIAQRHPDKAVRCVVGAKSMADINDLSQKALTADILVYNNAMATGVSFDAVGHYDEVHVMLGRGAVTSGLHVEQAIHRIRHPKTDTVTISGTQSSPVDDWRASPDGQVSEALERLRAGCWAVSSIRAGLSLASDWMMSPESQRLGWMQATVLAAQYQGGLLWVVPWLALQRHMVSAAPGADDRAFQAACRDARQQLDLTEAQAIATAEPLDSVDAERVDAHGAATLDEWHQARAAAMVGIYGDGYQQSPAEARADVAHRTKRQQLAQRTRVFAAACMLMHGQDDALASAEIKASKRKTFITAAPALPRARCLSVLLQQLARLPDDDGRRWVSEDCAKQLLKLAAPWMKVGGIKPRRDARAAPFTQLQTLLRFGGVQLDSVRSSQGSRKRLYYLADARVQRQYQLSQAMMMRWMKEEGSSTAAA